jgi:chorismate dehydratase
VALLPSIEYFRAGSYVILPEMCIAADGVVQSVRVFSKGPIDKVSSLALDANSRTSAALVQILLKRRCGGLPELTECAPEADLWSLKEDAMLLIGDPAMKFPARRGVHILDLGEEWKRQTGLPFVYALWVARKGVALGNLVERLLRARDMGLANLRQLAAEAGAELGLDENVCLRYLGETIKYHLGARELKGLSLFQRLAAEDGLCPGGAEIVVIDR